MVEIVNAPLTSEAVITLIRNISIALLAMDEYLSRFPVVRISEPGIRRVA